MVQTASNQVTQKKKGHVDIQFPQAMKNLPCIGPGMVTTPPLIGIPQ
jgi:hypothetical protein